LLNSKGQIAETTAANIFWIHGNVVYTPPTTSGILPGITREQTLKICKGLGLGSRLSRSRPHALRGADGVFLTLSSFGVVEVTRLDEAPLRRSPWTRRIWREYWRLAMGKEPI
jgi:branched-chain amino acid aminotransferase